MSVSLPSGSAGAAPTYRPAKVHLTTYDPRWPELYAKEAQRLLDIAGDQLVGLEHIGSTAIPGMTAKPIIDILAAVTNFEEFPTLVERLDGLGYLYTPESKSDDPARRVFRKGPANMQQMRTHHLHVTEAASHYWERIIAFRDYLRSHPAEATAYAELKRDLASRYEGEARRYRQGRLRESDRTPRRDHRPLPR